MAAKALLRLQGCLLRQTHNRLAAFFSIICLLISGCAQKTRPYSAHEAVEALRTQEKQVRTLRGRAWLSVQSPEQNFSFPANIVIDRSDPKMPKMRIDAMDPLGVTHAMILLTWVSSKSPAFQTVDFDQKQVISFQNKTWHGLPASEITQLLLGISQVPESGLVSSMSEDEFTITGKGERRVLQMTFIDPGPRLALQAWRGEMLSVRNQTVVAKYQASYAQFMDLADFYLPREVKIEAYEREKRTLDLNVQWRERRWNESIAPEIFQLPMTVQETFKKTISKFDNF